MFARSQFLRLARVAPVTPLRFYSQEAAPNSANALLKMIRDDLKASMKAKNTSRLNVIRGLLSDIQNQSRDLEQLSKELGISHILKIIKSNMKKTETSIEEAKKMGRQDLVEKDEAQLKVLEEFLGGIKTCPDEVVEKTVDKVLAFFKHEQRELNLSRLIEAVMAELEGQNALRGGVVKFVQQKLKAERK